MAAEQYHIISLPEFTLNSELVDQKIINKTFGENDFVELHIYDLNNNIILSEEQFTDFEITEDNNLQIDPDKILIDRGFITGIFKLRINVNKRKIFSGNSKPFIIKEISPSRTEIRTITPNIINPVLDNAVASFISEIESSVYFKEYILNFGENVRGIGINIVLNKNTNKHEVFFKLHHPLPDSIENLSSFNVVESIIDPVEIEVNLGNINIVSLGTPLRGPNFKIDVRQQNSIPSEYKTYDEILNYEVTSSYQHLLSRLETNKDIYIKYDHVRATSGSDSGANDILDISYHFENFVHFGDATERLKNFEYKLKLIESYDKDLNQINDSSLGDATSWSTLSGSGLVGVEDLEEKKEKIIKGFDGYEQFLYFETGSTYTWPKHSKNILYHTSHSVSKEWLGSDVEVFSNGETNPLYGGQLLSASLFDKQNYYSLRNTLPLHIVENPGNEYYISFINMIGQHFDHVWTYIKAITDINNAHNVKGISKELIFHKLKSIGIETFDQFENSNLLEYILGENISGSNFYGGDHYYNYASYHPSSSLGFGLAVSASESTVTASNDGSIPKGDITKEIWKRLYHNAPYLLKTKGTERGLKALMSCYGVPSTILNVKEYGGSVKDKNRERVDPGYKTFSYEKSGLALQGVTSGSQFFVKTKWSSSLTPEVSSKTIEFRIKPKRSSSAHYHLMSLSGSDATKDITLTLNPYTGSNSISSSGDTNLWGKIDLFLNGTINSSTNIFPVFNGKPWNIFIGTEGGSGDADLQFGAYQSNHLREISFYTSSLSITSATRQLNFGDFDGADYKGGAQFVYFGGIEANSHANYDNIDELYYSGSFQEIRYHYGELLSHSTLKKHALEPFMYSGNSISSSYSNLIFRLPLGSNDQRDDLSSVRMSSYHPNQNITYIEDFDGGQATATFPITFSSGQVAQSAGGYYITLTSLDGTSVNYAPFVSSNFATSDNQAGYTQGEVSQNSFDDVLQTMFDTNNVGNTSTNFCNAVNGTNGHNGKIICTVESDNSLTLTQATEGAAGNTTIEYNFPYQPNLQNGFWVPLFGGFQAGPTSFEGGADSDGTELPNPTYEEIIETHHLPTPDTVGISMTSEKVRIDEGEVDGNILHPTIRSEISTLDRQPLDYEDLGVFFSPTSEINEDIIYTLGSFRLDDYIGSPLPSAQTSSVYGDLKNIKDLYFKKVKRKYNYWDYIKQIQYIDHTLFKIIEQFVPAKANLKTGLLIEPHYLERNKFARELPKRSDGQTMITGSHQTFEVDLNQNDTITNFTYKALTGSMGGGNVVTTNNYVIGNSASFGHSNSNGHRNEQGTNATINVNSHILDTKQESAQAPIKPFTLVKPDNYVARQSSILLGNATKAKKSRKYYHSRDMGQAIDTLINNGVDPVPDPTIQ